MPGNVTFNSGDTEKTFSFAAATQDTADDDGESVKLGFGTMPAGVTEGTTKESVVSITDDDVPSVTVSYEQATYTVTEGSSVTVKVKLSADPERTVTIPVTKANQGGATSADYSGVPGNVTFNSGDTEVEITFAATQDTADDDGESVKLGFGTMPAGVSAGTNDETTVSIDDDDTTPVTLTSVQVSFGGYAYAVPEGSSVEVTMNLSDDPERTVTIPITITRLDGASDDDYSGVPENVTFSSGVTQTSFTFSATQDSVQDGGESVRLTLGDLPDGVTAGSPAEANFSITEGVGVSFDMATYVATEGGSDATVTVELSNPAPRQVVISLTAEGRYGAIPTDWSGVPEGLTFNAGDTSKTFTFVAVDDFIEDDGEMVELGFDILPPGFTPGSPSTARVTMMNDDPPPSDPVQTRCPDDSGERIVMVGRGEISQVGESEFWRVEMDPGRFYVVEVLGTNDGSDVTGEDTPGGLTLSDPHLYGVWNGDQSELIRKTGKRRSRVIVNRADDLSGYHQIEVRSFGGNTGTYQIKVRVNNICYMSGDKAIYSYAGGPDGYVWDTPSNSSTRDELRLHPTQSNQTTNLLGDNEGWYWQSEPDEDWYGIEGVKENYEYTIDVWTMDELPAKHQATRLKILGIYDSNGIEVPNTSSAGSGKKVSVTFQPDNTEMFYVSVGSDSSDRTGVYRISISARNLQESKNQRRRSAPREEPDKTKKDQPDGEKSSRKRVEPQKQNSPPKEFPPSPAPSGWARFSRRIRREYPTQTGWKTPISPTSDWLTAPI